MKTFKTYLFPLFLLLAFQAIGFGQDLYELKFSDQNGTKYKGLLVIFNEEKMYMRVAYNAENMYKVVNVDYTSEQGDEDGVEYLVMTGSNPRFITAAGNYGYNPDHLIFLEGQDVPYITDAPDDADKLHQADAFKALGRGDINDRYLREFYGSGEADYLALKQMFGLDNTRTTTTTTTTRNATLHLVIVANTSIGDIGGSCAIDQRNLVSEFKGISDALGIPFRKYLISGDDFARGNVISSLESLKPGSNDIVVFFYRGHGFRWSDQTGDWPQLDLRTSNYTRISTATSIGLAEVYNTIKGKGARLNIVLGDCCNSNVGISQVAGNSFLAMQSNNNYNVDKLRALFINSKGNLLATAAAPGEVSWANNSNGGFFTVSFLQSLREEISYLHNDTADWKDLILGTIRGARSKSTTQCSSCSAQNGIYYYNVTSN